MRVESDEGLAHENQRGSDHSHVIAVEDATESRDEGDSPDKSAANVGLWCEHWGGQDFLSVRKSQSYYCAITPY